MQRDSLGGADVDLPDDAMMELRVEGDFGLEFILRRRRSGSYDSTSHTQREFQGR